MMLLRRITQARLEVMVDDMIHVAEELDGFVDPDLDALRADLHVSRQKLQDFLRKYWAWKEARKI
jgi:hypothetical protein